MMREFILTSVSLFIILSIPSGSFSQELAIPSADDVPGSIAIEVREYLSRVERAKSEFRKSVDRANKQLLDEINRRQRRANVVGNDADEESMRAFLNQISKDHLKRNIDFDWTPIFRGETGEHFNTDHNEDREGFAIQLDREMPITYIRIKNLSDNQSVIVRCKANLNDLATEFPIDDDWIWNGKKQFFGKMVEGEVDRSAKYGWRLGLANKKWKHEYKDKATIAGGKYGYGGYGFARGNLVYDHHSTKYMWADQIQSKTMPIEISVTSKPLVTPNEGRILN